jgi:hypothetical protein
MENPKRSSSSTEAPEEVKILIESEVESLPASRTHFLLLKSFVLLQKQPEEISEHATRFTSTQKQANQCSLLGRIGPFSW